MAAVWWSLAVVRRLPFVVDYITLLVACCLLFAICWCVVFADRCVLRFACCMMFAACYMCRMCYLLFGVWCVLCVGCVLLVTRVGCWLLLVVPYSLCIVACCVFVCRVLTVVC